MRKAVEDYRTPRRFAFTRLQQSPTGLGLRQSSGALATAQGGLRETLTHLSRQEKSGRGLPHSKTLRVYPGRSESARSWTAPVLWRFGNRTGRIMRNLDPPDQARGKAVEDYRTPRRFAFTRAVVSPTGLGLRQSSGALATAQGGLCETLTPPDQARGKAVEDY